MDKVIGYITLTDYDKSLDYYLVLSFLSLSLVLLTLVRGFNVSFVELIKIHSLQKHVLSKFSHLAFLIYSIGLSPLISLLYSLCLILFSSKRSIEARYESYLIFFGVLLAALGILNAAEDLFTGFLFLSILTISLSNLPQRYFLLFIIIFYLKFTISPHFAIVDTFHTSEFFTSVYPSQRDVFANIGLIEQKLPLYLSQALNFIFGTEKFISLSGAHSLLMIALTSLFVREVNKVSIILGVVALLFFPTGRLGVAVAALISIKLINSRNLNFTNFLLLAISPYVCLHLSPTYAIFIVVAGSNFLLALDRRDYKLAGLLIFIVLSEVLALHSELLNYVKIYTSFSASNLEAGSLPLANGGWDEALIKLLSVFSVSFILYQCFERFCLQFDLTEVSRTILVITLLYLTFSYGFGRVDPGPSRLYSITVLLFFCVVPLRKIPTINLFGFLIVMLYYFPQTIFERKEFNESQTLFPKYEYVSVLDSELLLTTSILNHFKELTKRDLILFSDPALAVNQKYKLPPFTTPWVAIGELAEEKVIKFFRENNRDAIYLGESFITFDGVDIRARAPRIFKFLSLNYDIVTFEKKYFLIPKSDRKYYEILNIKIDDGNKLFSGFNLGYSGRYFTGRLQEGDYYIVSLKSACIEGVVSNYTVVNNNNSFSLDGECENQHVPRSFFDGEILNVKRNY